MLLPSTVLFMISLSSKIQSQLLPVWQVTLTSLLSWLALLTVDEREVQVPPTPDNHRNQHRNETQTSRQFISTYDRYILTPGFPGGHFKIFHVPFAVARYSLYPKLKASRLCGIQRSSLQSLKLKFYLYSNLHEDYKVSGSCLQTPSLETLLWFCKYFQFQFKDTQHRDKRAWRSSGEPLHPYLQVPTSLPQ